MVLIIYTPFPLNHSLSLDHIHSLPPQPLTFSFFLSPFLPFLFHFLFLYLYLPLALFPSLSLTNPLTFSHSNSPCSIPQYLSPQNTHKLSFYLSLYFLHTHSLSLCLCFSTPSLSLLFTFIYYCNELSSRGQ